MTLITAYLLLGALCFFVVLALTNLGEYLAKLTAKHYSSVMLAMALLLMLHIFFWPFVLLTGWMNMKKHGQWIVQRKD